MNNGDAVLAAVLSLREATEQRFNQFEAEMARRFDAMEVRFSALESRLDRFEVKVLQRFYDLEGRLISVESR
jgi:uncharacterized protein Yka (UPF0111/DUF47 family)